jgi:hypothetical protein
MSSRREALGISVCTLATVLALTLCACSSGKRPPTEPAPAPAPVTAAPAMPAAAPQPTPAIAVEEREPTPQEVPIAEDFASEAARQITVVNFRAELDALEKEMNSEK